MATNQRYRQSTIAGHVVAFLFPRELLAFNSKPIGLYALEITALSAGFMTVPFTRLVHVLVIPNPYLWRKPQVVR